MANINSDQQNNLLIQKIFRLMQKYVELMDCMKRNLSMFGIHNWTKQVEVREEWRRIINEVKTRLDCILRRIYSC